MILNLCRYLGFIDEYFLMPRKIEKVKVKGKSYQDWSFRAASGRSHFLIVIVDNHVAKLWLTEEDWQTYQSGNEITINYRLSRVNDLRKNGRYLDGEIVPSDTKLNPEEVASEIKKDWYTQLETATMYILPIIFAYTIITTDSESSSQNTRWSYSETESSLYTCLESKEERCTAVVLRDDTTAPITPELREEMLLFWNNKVDCGKVFKCSYLRNDLIIQIKRIEFKEVSDGIKKE